MNIKYDNTILSQLGGNKFIAMTGSRKLFSGAIKMNALERLESMTEDELSMLTTYERVNLYNNAEKYLEDINLCSEVYYSQFYNKGI